ncbi:MAG: GNAT family N-acetyltransferase [Nevskia sp.]|uniref:GNAT family N-acetyltransferase n=1 Tax=Nevskia sp. TaxID=1929292 RepID=UPI00403744DF
MSADDIAIATAADADTIAQLVNAAYRPAPGGAGWTHESALVSGPRITAAQVLSALSQVGHLILVARTTTGIAACVEIRNHGACCLLGMLAVAPAGQCTGLGKRMLEQAERHAADVWHCSTVRISVLSQRRELLSFYRRRGYLPTGLVSPYPAADGVGAPLLDGLTIDTLEKTLARNRAAPEEQP